MDYGAIGAALDTLDDDTIVGIDEIVGRGDFDPEDADDLMRAIVNGGLGDQIVGGRGRGGGRQSMLARIASKMQQARQIDPDAILIREEKLTKRRRLILPIPVTLVQGGQNKDIEIKPQNLFKTTRMLVSSDIAFGFRITDVKIAQKPQFVQAGSMPANCFSEVSVGSYVDWDSANLGSLIVISVFNKTLGELEFEGTLLGTAAKS